MGASFTLFHVAALALGDIKACRCLAVQLTHDGWLDHLIMLAICIGLAGVAWYETRSKRAAGRSSRDLLGAAT